MLDLLQEIVDLIPRRPDPDTHNWTDLARLLGQVRELAAGGVEAQDAAEPDVLPEPAVIPPTPPVTPEAAAVEPADVPGGIVFPG